MSQYPTLYLLLWLLVAAPAAWCLYRHLLRVEKKLDALMFSRKIRKPVTLGRIRVTRKRKRRKR